MKWEKLPNGKWKPIKDFKTNKNGKYDPSDPKYIAVANKKMALVILECDVCGKSTLLNPCVHHLPDGYKNEQRRKQYSKALKESRSITERKANGVLTSNS